MAASTKKKVNVRFIITEHGEFLYDEKTMQLYTCTTPHILVGKIEKNMSVSLLKK